MTVATYYRREEAELHFLIPQWSDDERVGKLPKRQLQLQPDKMIDAVVAGPEASVLDVAHEVLREQGVASQKR